MPQTRVVGYQKYRETLVLMFLEKKILVYYTKFLKKYKSLKRPPLKIIAFIKFSKFDFLTIFCDFDFFHILTQKSQFFALQCKCSLNLVMKTGKDFENRLKFDHQKLHSKIPNINSCPNISVNWLITSSKFNIFLINQFVSVSTYSKLSNGLLGSNFG